MAGQFPAAHMRHHHVGQHEVDPAGFQFALAQRIGAAFGGDDIVAIGGENVGRIVAHLRLVLDHQYRLVAGSIRENLGQWSNLRRLRRDARQVDPERRPAPRLALDLHATAALGDNALDGRQPQPGATANFLGREERLEDMPPRFFVHADAGVAHGQHDIASRARAGMQPCRSFVPLHLGRADRDLAAVGHRIARVHNQVHHDLFHLVRVGENFGDPRIEAQLHLDVLPHQARQHRLQTRHHLIQIERPGVEDLLAAVGQQLPRQLRRALARRQDFLDRFALWIGRLQFLEQQMAIAVDHHQQIVEIVRHPARQAAHRFHPLDLNQVRFGLQFLRQPQRFFGLLQHRDIADDHAR